MVIWTFRAATGSPESLRGGERRTKGQIAWQLSPHRLTILPAGNSTTATTTLTNLVRPQRPVRFPRTHDGPERRFGELRATHFLNDLRHLLYQFRSLNRDQHRHIRHFKTTSMDNPTLRHADHRRHAPNNTTLLVDDVWAGVRNRRGSRLFSFACGISSGHQLYASYRTRHERQRPREVTARLIAAPPPGRDGDISCWFGNRRATERTNFRAGIEAAR